MTTVFLSYRHENDEHRKRVRVFAERLRTEGGSTLTVILDQFAHDEEFQKGGPPAGWPQWSSQQASEAERILIVGSPGWYRCYEGKEQSGLGVATEAGIIQQRIYNRGGKNPDIRIFLLAPEDEAGIPLELQRYHRFRDFAELLTWLTGTASTSVPGSSSAGSPTATPAVVAPSMGVHPRTLASPRSPKLVLLHEIGESRSDQWDPAAATKDEAFNSLTRLAINRRFVVDVLKGKPITIDRLRRASCFILTVGPRRMTYLDKAEIEDIRTYIRQGGGLLLLGTHFGDGHHLANLNALVQTYDISFNEDAVMPAGSSEEEARWTHGKGAKVVEILVAKNSGRATAPGSAEDPRWDRIQKAILMGLDRIKTLDCCSVQVGQDAVPLLPLTSPNLLFKVHYVDQSSGRIDRCEELPGGTGWVMAASTRGKVVAVGGWRTFINAFLDDPGCSNSRLYLNVLRWLSG